LNTVLLDSHTVHWWSAESRRLSRAAARAVSNAEHLAVASITWWELASLVRGERIKIQRPLRSWLEELAANFRTVPITPAIAETAASLSTAFPRDPVDRLIYATAIETGWPLITKDERMRDHPYPRRVVIW
jgi:PIN domain nuclease of toxin-antitoxin system